MIDQMDQGNIHMDDLSRLAAPEEFTDFFQGRQIRFTLIFVLDVDDIPRMRVLKGQKSITRNRIGLVLERGRDGRPPNNHPQKDRCRK